ncbi:hypothetical protein GLOIN_2v1763427 [Rhizophagus irregularis DAOM 181602=DAOM 197198]|uniref:Uncharacterized protein n=1 Tax=Rhizophagus irregularis (strain DAOM 181602 / DAOM 197198 / MUCL 43194) TaxID=747089 RepID=A0A2P4QU61_RHIID|nr:hypothetical protein GLOIN_2v1763427 [Rhizophagus irregularis DAOM 181602=DAOM 197198]POG81190.1 hypothetical protein GLOIN_2v1763427 [Rhizophagus irregularis DAOM 181602=DAOM 197198]|eukprot:XP_025188056.1 hypothetical protein GLOIN_2v1763427 [Rhizophagus irregularis DAOM 181602=DAOM 197198]
MSCRETARKRDWSRQAGHFNRYALEKVPYTINRYTDEAKRLHYVLNGALEESIDEFPNLKTWVAQLMDNPEKLDESIKNGTQQMKNRLFIQT